MNGYALYMTPFTQKQATVCRSELALAHTDHNKALNAYAFYKLSDYALGQDLVQDTFVKTWGYMIRNGKINGMRSFLYHILNNLIVDEYRKKKYKSTSLEVLMEKGFSPSFDNSGSFINIMDGKRAILLIKDLPVVYQEVMNMRYIQDLSLKEMSVLTGQSENTLSVRVHRGVSKLKLLYSPI